MSQNEITNLVGTLNKIYPTSLINRMNHITKEFTKRSRLLSQTEINTCVKEVTIDKDVTIEIIKLNDNIVGNARKTDNIIQLNPDLLTGDIEIGSGYKKEDTKLKRNVNTNSDLIKWVIIHEYTHLLHPEFKHTNQFFNKVEEIYIIITKTFNKILT